MKPATIAFLGGGNMARSIIAGLIKDGYDTNRIWVADRNEHKRTALTQHFQIHATDNASDACTDADIIILAVKPQGMQTLADQVGKHTAKTAPLIISIAAGITLESLAMWFGPNTPLVRTMPNTPSLVGTGATALFANDQTTNTQRNQAECIMRAVGIVTWVKDEALIDVVAAMAGSGPAYYFLFMEIMAQIAVEMGLTEKDAQVLSLQTALGAAKLAYESNEDLSTLRKQVTSKGGTTAEALKSFEASGVVDMFRKAMQANLTRSKLLSQELSARKKIS